MKKLLIITTKARIRLLCAILLLVLGITILLITLFVSNNNSIKTLESNSKMELEEIITQNKKYREIFLSILPEENTVIFEDTFRNPPPDTVPNISTSPLLDVIKKGSQVNYELLLSESNYSRPVYIPDWKAAYFRWWLYLPNKNIEARHRLFIFPLGLSATFDFTGSLGFDRNILLDAHRNINFLIYDFEIKSIKKYHNQITFVGHPQRNWVTVAAVNVNDILTKGSDKENFLFQLSTPGGYEIDYLYESYGKSDYLKKLEQENESQASFKTAKLNSDITKAVQENERLRKELINFIPYEDKIVTTQQCRKPDISNFKEIYSIETVRKQGKGVKYKVNYDNKQFRRPLYHPLWKDNYEKGWAFVPRQVCTNMHLLHLIPRDRQKLGTFLGTQAFNENYKTVQPDEIGVLIYNFNTEAITMYNNQIVLTGVPLRSGAQVVTISKSLTPVSQLQLIRLATPDNHEVDYIVLDPTE